MMKTGLPYLIGFIGRGLFSLMFFFSFCPVQAQPTISSFSPLSGPVGTAVIINGSNFSATPANNIVYFGPVKATVTAASATSLTVTVPTGTNYQPITVTVNNLTAYSTRSFIVTYSGGGNINSTTFDTKTDFTTDLNPNDIIVVDLDGDGKPDFVTSNNYNTGGASSISAFRNTSTSGTLSFAPKQDFSNGALSYTLEAGDIDGDGKQDIITCSIGDQTMSVYRNTSITGTISFAPRVSVATSSGTFGIAVADIDGDGKPDVAVANKLSNTLSVYRNTSIPGVVSFAPRVDFTTLLAPENIVAGDMDGDNKPDIAVTNELSNSFSVFRNTSTIGSVSFAARTDISNGNEPRGILLSDLDGDGKLDITVVIFITATSNSAAQIFRNNCTVGSITFPFATSVSGAAGDAYHINAGDINGDGKVDLALAMTSQDKTRVFQSNSSPGSFSFTQAGEFGSFFPYPALLDDLDTDSKPELITTFFNADKASVLLNRCGLPGIVSFSPQSGPTGTVVTITGNNFTGATAVTFGGVPASSFTVVNATTITATVANGASGSITVTTPVGSGSLGGFTYNGPPVITSFNPTSSGSGATITITGTNFTGATAVSFGGVAAASFTVVNSTTITAVVGTGATGSVSVTTPFGTGSLAGYTYLAPTLTSFNPTSGSTGTTITLTGTNFTGATAVSFGGTPASSFTVVNSTTITAVVAGGSTGSVSVTTSFGSASLNGFTYISLPPPVVTSFSPLSGFTGSSVQINGTNFNATAANNIVYFGATKATVTTAAATQLTVTVPNGSSFKPLSVLNTSNNLAGNSNITFIATFPNAGSVNANSFPARTDLSTGASTAPVDVEVGDIDGDGKPDLIFGHVTGPVGVIRNMSSSGTLNFSPVLSLTGFNVQRVSLGDIDGDGKLDIIGVNGVDNSVAVARNTSTTGNISFATPVGFLTNLGSQKIGVGDIDGDGKPDIVVGFGASSLMSVLRNTSIPGIISMAPKVDFPTGGSPESAVVSDIDGDGKMDILLSNGFVSSTISVFRNTSIVGTISLAGRVDFATGSQPKGLAIADLDGDGKNDLLVANTTASFFSIFRNTSNSGSISFAPRIDQTIAPGFCLNVSVADVDADSKADVITSVDRTNTGVIGVHKNNSTSGTISLAAQIDFSNGISWSSLACDMDGDQKPDLVGAFPNWSFISILKSNVNNQPFISSFSPVNGTTGTSITILGANFTGASAVSFGGTAAQSFVVNSSSSITAVVGTGTSGNISVTTPNGVASLSGFNFYLIPAISSFNPTSAVTGATITITGSNFNGATTVSFGGIAAQSFTIINNTTITAVVGAGTSGSVTVANPVGSASLPGFTYLPPPTISSFTPTSGAAGATITITGANFTGATAVRFGGTAASSFAVVNATTISAIVGSGSSGAVSVTTPGGTASLAGFTFIFPPVITSFTPTNGTTSTVITINGTNFTGATAVSFGGVAATSFIVVNSTTITAVVGAGASGLVSVTTPGGTASLAGFTYNIITAVGGVNANNSPELTVSPNPGHDIIFIRYPSSVKNSNLKLIAIDGKAVRAITVARNSTQSSLIIRGLATGIYKLIWTDGKRTLRRTVMISE